MPYKPTSVSITISFYIVIQTQKLVGISKNWWALVGIGQIRRCAIPNREINPMASYVAALSFAEKRGLDRELGYPSAGGRLFRMG